MEFFKAVILLSMFVYFFAAKIKKKIMGPAAGAFRILLHC